jgi:hypothetical protein
MPATRLEPVWNPSGTRLDPFWNPSGTRLEPVWNRTRTRLEHGWNLSGTCLEPVWNLSGTCHTEDCRCLTLRGRGPMIRGNDAFVLCMRVCAQAAQAQHDSSFSELKQTAHCVRRSGRVWHPSPLPGTGRVRAGGVAAWQSCAAASALQNPSGTCLAPVWMRRLCCRGSRPAAKVGMASELCIAATAVGDPGGGARFVRRPARVSCPAGCGPLEWRADACMSTWCQPTANSVRRSGK